MIFYSLYSILHWILYVNGCCVIIVIEPETNIVKPRYLSIAFVGLLAVFGVIFILSSVFLFLMPSRFHHLGHRTSVRKIRDDSCRYYCKRISPSVIKVRAITMGISWWNRSCPTIL